MDDQFSNLKKCFISADYVSRIVKDRAAEAAPNFEVMDEVSSKRAPKPNLITSLVAGAAAGTVVDISLFPLDTIKTRLQSPQGFSASGGFRGVYKGIAPVLIGSAPTSAIFFCSYNGLINIMKKDKNRISDHWIHFIAASISETISGCVRVPLELVKQRKQTSVSHAKSIDILKQTVALEGFSGLYRGFASTISREIPFAAIQFPLWEFLKKQISLRHNRPVTTFETAYCGAAAGGVSAAITTPMDVIKTRIMLANYDIALRYGRMISIYIARDIFVEHGLFGFFAGIVPRTLWITIGGFIYFGMYEFMKVTCEEQTFIPVKKTGNGPCIRDFHLLKDIENRKLVMAQSSAAYSEDDWNDVACLKSGGYSEESPDSLEG